MQIILKQLNVLTNGYLWSLTEEEDYNYEQIGSVVFVYKAPYIQNGSEVTIL